MYCISISTSDVDVLWWPMPRNCGAARRMSLDYQLQTLSFAAPVCWPGKTWLRLQSAPAAQFQPSIYLHASIILHCQWWHEVAAPVWDFPRVNDEPSFVVHICVLLCMCIQAVVGFTAAHKLCHLTSSNAEFWHEGSVCLQVCSERAAADPCLSQLEWHGMLQHVRTV